jgi:NAD(P)-dependent dehydrogenase (short-subunit alcohol dehydrogenase family)
MEQSFSSKVALVTGGNSGLGRAIALAFAEQGAKVVVAARRVADSEETVSMIRDAGGEAMFVQTDVAKTEEVQAMVAVCIREYGQLDIAVNNAGIEGTPMVPTADYDEATWRQVIDVNLTGVFLCMKYEIPEMLSRGQGCIVNMSSVAGLVGGRIGAAYYASKHGVIGATKAAALEYADQGIRINAVCPAIIETPMVERAFDGDEAMRDRFRAVHPVGRFGRPEEVASATLWLCSEGAAFTIGHALAVDGGRLI